MKTIVPKVQEAAVIDSGAPCAMAVFREAYGMHGVPMTLGSALGLSGLGCRGLGFGV